MDIDKLEKELQALGYDREDSLSFEIGNDATLCVDLAEKSLNHTILSGCKINNTNFDFAAATGSIYKNCEFNQCSMYQTDFEFCNFYGCDFTSKKTVMSSFNSCNFIGCDFNDIDFEVCTFTGAFFENCTLKNVVIKNSTLENSLFRKCTFIDMDLRNLNMDYVYIEEPKMINVVLPFAQIPYMFGCLQYIMGTTDDVRISSYGGGTISVQEYLENALPLLLQYWNKKRDSRPDFFFPLSNVYIAQESYLYASTSLKNGLTAAVASHDFRMIKFYCKLISFCDFDLHTIHKFYNLINRFGVKNDIANPEMRSFMRNIGEIRATLFSSVKKATLQMLFRTNTFLNDTDKLGRILGKMFSISKMQGCMSPNTVELTLSENSPLMISLQIIGDEENIITLMPALLKMAGKTSDEISCFVPVQDVFGCKNELMDARCDAEILADELVSECASNKIEIYLAEYSLTNCDNARSLGIVPFFYENWSEGNIWETEMFLLQG